MSQAWLVKVDGRACVRAVAPDALALAPRKQCVIRLEFGETLGTICSKLPEGEVGTFEILRLVSPEDRGRYERNQEVATRLFEAFRASLGQSQKVVKLLSGKLSLRGDVLSLYYGGQGIVNLHERAKRFGREHHVHVEVRQVGARSEAMMLGGIGPCGREICCVRLGSYQSPTPSALRIQGATPMPEFSAGLCGEFKCCFAFEEETYREAKVHLPKEGSTVYWKGQTAKVVVRSVPLQSLVIEVDQGQRVSIKASEISKEA